MKKMMRSVSLAAILLFTANAVGAETVTIEKTVLDQILRRQKEMAEKIERLERRLEQQAVPLSPKPSEPEKPASAIPAAPSPQIIEDVEYLKEDMEEVTERLDVVETRSILDKVQIGGEFRVQFDHLNFKDYLSSEEILFGGEPNERRIDELWSSRLRLNLRSEITENLIFSGRLAYYKYWGETNFELDHYDSRFFNVPRQDGDLHVERAYFDWFIPDTPLSFTAGRLPTSDGPPYGFKNSTTRKATWTQLFVDGEFDGVLANFSLEDWTGWKYSMLHAAYVTAAQNYRQYEGDNVKTARVIEFNFETQLPKFDDSFFWIGYMRISDINPLVNFGPPYPDASGDMDILSGHIQFKNIAGTGLGWFASYAHQFIDPESEGKELMPGMEVGLGGDSMHGDLGDSRTAYAFYTGLRYILPIEALNRPHIGVEFNYGSQYWMSAANSGFGEFTNKFGVNGHAYEAYWLQPVIPKHMFFRIGGLLQEFDYYPPFWIYGSREGDETRSDLSILHTYFLMDIRF